MSSNRRYTDLTSAEFGAFLDQCQTLLGSIAGCDAWRSNDLRKLVERIPRRLTEPQRAVVQNVLLRVFVARVAPEGPGLINISEEAARFFVIGDVRRAFLALLDALATRPDSRPPATGGAMALPKSNDPRIDMALDYLRQSYGDSRLNLKLVAAHVHLSRWHFDRLLMRLTGAGLRTHLIRIRMAKARELLEVTSLQVKEVSANVGYKQVSEFDRHFKRFFGVRPTILRKSAFGRTR